jgi:ABC-type multidrug transport system fused ATPase/permease subunit
VFGLLSKFTDLRKHYSNITKQAAKGTIIENEADEAVVVEAATYRKLIKYNGGPIMLIMVNVVMIGFMLSSIYMNLLLMEWANQPQDVQYSRLEHYTLWIFGFAVCTAVCIFARVAILLFGSLRATRLLHDKIFAKVIRAPINLYFDVTPIGKILNRFSKDLQVLDN